MAALLSPAPAQLSSVYDYDYQQRLYPSSTPSSNPSAVEPPTIAVAHVEGYAHYPSSIDPPSPMDDRHPPHNDPSQIHKHGTPQPQANGRSESGYETSGKAIMDPSSSSTTSTSVAADAAATTRQQHYPSQPNANGVYSNAQASTSTSNSTQPIPSPSSSAVPPTPQSQQGFTAANNGGFPPAVAPPGTNPYPPPLQQPLPPVGTRSYTVLKEVGDGSFGTVWLADWHSPLFLPPGTQPPGPSSRPEYKGKRLVAIKRMKKCFEGGWDECMKLKELKSLRTIPMHPNIIPLYDSFLLPTSKELYFVFECMEGNLYQLTKSRKRRPLAGGLVASLFYQILAGLHHIHVSGYFHRDMKPENLLITTTGLADYPPPYYGPPNAAIQRDVTVIVKLADFGLARETSSKPPYTEYVSTRWYRAPEVLLRSRDYSNPVDTWALGTILAEMVTLQPLFPGQSEVDQVFRICEVLGDPVADYGVDERGRMKGGGPWEKGQKMAKAVGFQFPKVVPVNFAGLFDPNHVPPQLVDCMADLLRYEPAARLTTQQCLDHAYFREVAPRLAPIPSAPPQPVFPPTPSSANFQQQPNSAATAQNPAAGPLSPPSSASRMVIDLPQRVSPRHLPPSHSHGTPAYHKPPFGVGDPNFIPPVPALYGSPGGQRQQAQAGPSSLPSTSAHARRTSQASSAFSDHESVRSARSGGMPMYLANGQPAYPMPNGATSAYEAHLVAQGHDPHQPLSPALLQQQHQYAMSLRQQQQSQDMGEGSSAQQQQRSGDDEMAVDDPRAQQAILMSPMQLSAGQASQQQQQQLAQLRAQQQQQQQAAQTASLGPAGGRSRWMGMFGNESKGIHGAPGLAPLPSLASQSSLKRSPSGSSTHQPEAPVGAAPSALDHKKAKKEAKRAAEEAEKAKRDAAYKAARDRARAVMQKRTQLQQLADPLHWSSSLPRANPNTLPGQVPPGVQISPMQMSPSMPNVVGVKDKGKQRMMMVPHPTHILPQIAEDRLQPIMPSLNKARRRDDDDDVHSISSNETRGSGQSARRFSVSSRQTVDSDPGPARSARYPNGISRVPSMASLSGSLRTSMEPIGRSSTSSLDSSLITGLQGLTAGEGAHGGDVSPGNGRSHFYPHHPSMLSPSASMPSMRPTLPGIHTLDYPPPQGELGFQNSMLQAQQIAQAQAAYYQQQHAQAQAQGYPHLQYPSSPGFSPHQLQQSPSPNEGASQ